MAPVYSLVCVRCGERPGSQRLLPIDSEHVDHFSPALQEGTSGSLQIALPSFAGIPPPAVFCGRRSLTRSSNPLSPYRYYADALGGVVTGKGTWKRRAPRSLAAG